MISFKMKLYCRKGKTLTDCVEPSGYKTAKNGRLMFFLPLCFLRNKKDSICFETGKLNIPPLDGGSLASLGKMAGKAGKKQLKWGDSLRVNGCVNLERKKCW